MLRALFWRRQMGALSAPVWEIQNLLLVLPRSSGMTLGGELNPVISSVYV